MVVWVFAGGGKAELKGLIIFLQKNFPQHTFERKTPINDTKPGPRPGIQSLGRTGKSLVQQIRYFLPISLKDGICDKILVLDDLDCHLIERYRQKFVDAALEILNGRNVSVLTVFASPEIEAWLIADWENSFGKEFKSHQVEIRRKLSQKYKKSRPDNMGNIEHPESFSYFDSGRDTCTEKLSRVVVTVVEEIDGNYSKDEHSGRMLQNINAARVCEKCPSARGLLQL